MSELLQASFGSLLRSLRTAAGLTQEELGEAARVSYRSISDLERGVSRYPRRDTARLLADALGLSGDDRAGFEAAARGRLSPTGNVAPRPLPEGIAAAAGAVPPDTAAFTGREPEIESVLTAAAGAGSAAGICAISGTAGAGKTALAVHAAHRLAGRFPDGQVFLPLHGHTPGRQPVDPADALASLLRASGIPPQGVPDGLEPRARLWRARLAGRRMLLVLDDAAGSGQVAPLLPGDGGCLVLVTSRRRLDDLPGAVTPVLLDVLTPAQGGTAPGGAGSPQAPPGREPVRAWGNVPARNPAFAGREEQLAGIRQALAGEGGRAAVQALHGMGGVGKTQLAIEYAHRHSGDYDVTWWLDSENTALMTQQYADLAEHLGAAPKGLPLDAMRRALLSDLHRRPRWLLVFDNAEDPAFLRDWLPSGPGHVIITSRSQDWAELAAPVLVDVLPRPESVELLRARVPGITTADAETLAGALGDLPLALAQAAAFLAGTRMPAAGYTQLLKDRAAALLSKGKPLTYRDTLSAATALACDRLRAADSDAAGLAEICAFLAPEPVPVSWLVTAAGKLPGGLPARLPDPLERGDLVAALTRTSLAQLNDDGLTMHRLTQAILRARSAEPDKARAHAEAIITANAPQSTLAPGTWPTWGRLLPHLLALAPERSGNPGLQTAAVQAAAYLLDSGKVPDALSFVTRIHGLWRDRLGPDDRQTLRIANMLVSAHRLSGHLDQARQLGEDNLGRSRRLYGDDDPDTLHIANNLAIVLHALGDYRAARELNEHALRHLRRVRGGDHPMTLASAMNLADDLHALGDYNGARGLNEDTLQRCRRTLGDNNLATLICAANLASNLRELDDPHAARALHQDVFQRSRRALGKDHPTSLIVASDLAADLRVLGRYRAARALDEDTLKRSRRVLSDDHPDALRLTEELRALRETQRPPQLPPQPGSPP